MRKTVILLLTFLSHRGISEPAKVTKYIIEVQEERRDTRWTLTEWLRIKERMKMMDLWLALVNDPAKSTFRPEFSASYTSFKGSITDPDGVESAVNGNSGRGALWLTNLISGTLGIRTINIDLGVEGFGRKMTSTNSSRTSYTGNLRIFGKHVQDTSLVLKYGMYQASVQRNLLTESEHGRVVGGALQLYILSSLGAESNFEAYGKKAAPTSASSTDGRYIEYAGFLEVSVIRLLIGKYQEVWSEDGIDTTESGSFAGVKLQF